MCLAVFIASDTPLYSGSQAGVFSLAPLSVEQEPVRVVFSRAFVYSAVAHTGCGCSFRHAPDDLEILSYLDVPEDWKKRAKEDHEARRESVRCLGAQIARAVTDGGLAELYACWYGDFEADPTPTRRSVAWQTLTLQAKV
jgi:hypothetical protein